MQKKAFVRNEMVAASRIPRLRPRILATHSNRLNTTRSLDDLSLARSLEFNKTSLSPVLVCCFCLLIFICIHRCYVTFVCPRLSVQFREVLNSSCSGCPAISVWSKDRLPPKSMLVISAETSTLNLTFCSSSWFCGVVGYHFCLTHRRSPVRARAESLFLPFFQASFCPRKSMGVEELKLEKVFENFG